MPTEQALRANPLQQHTVGRIVVWFDEDNAVFCIAEADSGDCGDTYDTYEALCEAEAIENAE